MADIETMISEAMIRSIKSEMGISDKEQEDSPDTWFAAHRPDGRRFKPLPPVYEGIGDYLPYRIAIGTSLGLDETRFMLREMFGPQTQPAIMSRYYLHPHYVIHFREERDCTMFLLRWSNV